MRMGMGLGIKPSQSKISFINKIIDKIGKILKREKK